MKTQSISTPLRQFSPRRSLQIALGATFLLVLQAIPPLLAADVTWSSTGNSTPGGDGNWTGGSTWWNGSSGVPWTAGDNAFFTAAGNTTVNSAVAVNRITFSNSTDNISILGGAGTLTLTSGITAINTDNTTALTYTISESIALPAAQTWAVTNGGTTGTVNLAVSGTLSGNGNITKLGGGTLTLSGNNTRTGQLVMGLNSPSTTGGTVKLEHNNAIGTSGALILWENDGIVELAINGLSIANSTLIQNRSSATDGKRVYRLDLAGSNTGIISGGFDIRRAGGTTFDVGADDTLTLSGNILNGANTGSFEKTGTGTLVLTGASNTVTGSIVVSAGTLQIGNGGTTGTLNSSANAVTNNGALVFNRSDDITVGNAIRGSGSLIKNGNATLTLTNANTYSGATTISNGTLVLGAAGSISNSSSISVASDATFNVSAVTGGWALGSSQTLSGSGSVMGNANINGNLQPGNSPGILSFSNNLTLGTTANTTMEILGDTTRGADFDGINVTSALTYDGTLTLDVGTTFGAGFYTFNLFDFGSQSGSFDTITLSGFYSGNLTNSTGDVWSLIDGDNTWTFTHSSGDLGLEVIPEPSTWALLALGVGVVALKIRRRSRRA